MTSPTHTHLHAPPLPRYRYHPKTGLWRKERVQAEDDGATAAAIFNATGTVQTAGAPSPAAAKAPTEPFESSYDFFLRSVRPPVQQLSPAEREEWLRERTSATLRLFESHLLNSPRWGSSKGRTAGASATSHRAPTAAGLHSPRSTSITLTPLHPLVGYASTAALPAIYAALMEVMGHPLSFATTTPQDCLTRGQFRTLLGLIGPAEVLSTEYADTMFASLPSYDVGEDSVSAAAVFTLLMEHRHHPRLNVNVEALFDAFDSSAKGVVPAEVLNADVLLAWATQRTFGNLRDQWQRFAGVIEREQSRNADKLPLMPSLASRTAIAGALCSVPNIYAAACSLDLDGASL